MSNVNICTWWLETFGHFSLLGKCISKMFLVFLNWIFWDHRTCLDFFCSVYEQKPPWVRTGSFFKNSPNETQELKIEFFGCVVFDLFSNFKWVRSTVVASLNFWTYFWLQKKHTKLMEAATLVGRDWADRHELIGFLRAASERTELR